MVEVRAVAHANIALAKYWGKLPDAHHLPAVPSLSLTLDALRTVTRACFDEALSDDEFLLNGHLPDAAGRAKMIALIDRVRAMAGLRARCRVESRNDFPTSSGLASSASGFAALAAAVSRAAGLSWDPPTLSDFARQASTSAARSVYGGFVVLPQGTAGQTFLPAEPLEDGADWDIALLVVVTTEEPKKVSSTQGMLHTVRTSPYYRAWTEAAPRMFEEIRSGVRARDLERVGSAMEQSSFAMHASAIAATPALLYWSALTVELLHEVFALRAGGTPAYSTMDAGPHVKVLCRGSDAQALAARLSGHRGVSRVLLAGPGPGVSVEIAGDLAGRGERI